MKILQKKLEHVYNTISGKQVIIITIIFVLFTSFVLPFVSAETTRIIGISESPDLNFNFDVSHIFSIVEQYGKDGRRFYVIMRWTFDVVWPFIYTIFLGSAIAYLARRSSCRFTYKPLYFVLLAVLFDLLENINATILMLLYPIESTIVAYLLLVSSMFKWLFISFAFLMLFLLLIRFIVSSFRKTRI